MNQETQEVIELLRTLISALETEEAEVLSIEHENNFKPVSYDGFTVDYFDTRIRKETIIWKWR